MGMMRDFLMMFFGSGRNVVAETAEVFRVNAEAEDRRASEHRGAALGQYAAEFEHPCVGGFDQFINGLNRLPRPMMAFGVLGLLVAAIVNPVWFSQRMVGIALVPEPMWWLMGAIVSFYFGARHQAHGQNFQRSIAETMARVPQVVQDLSTLEALAPTATAPRVADPTPDARVTQVAVTPSGNAALDDWMRTQP